MEISRHGRIDDLGKLLLGVQPADRTTARKVATGEAGQDRVEISAAAKELQRVRELSHAGEAARAQKVQQLKEAVERGTYTVKGQVVADRLIQQTLIDGVL